MRNKTLTFLCLLGIALGLSASRSAAQQKALQNTEEAAAIEILEKNVAALGGRDAFSSIKSIEIQLERAVLGRTIKSVQIDDFAGKRSYNRQDSGDGGVIEVGFDGQKAWQKAPFFRGYLDAANVQAKSLMRGGISLPGASLYDYKTSGKKFTRLPDEQIGGKNYLVVKGAKDADQAGNSAQIKYYFDPATYLLKQIVSGNAVTQTETFDDYRKVRGVTIAYASSTVNPQFAMTSKITDLKFNVPVNAAIFEFQEMPAPPAAVKPVADGGAAASESPKTAETSPAKADGEITESLRLETFETVWKTINDTFFDRSFNGVNWQAVHDRYEPLVKATANSDDFHQLLDRMVQELHLSHFKVIPPKNTLTLSSGAASLTSGSTGLSLKWVENQLLVSQVKKDSPVALAGIKPGFILQRANGKTPEEIYAEYQKDNPGFHLREELARVRAVAGEMSGKPNAKINLELLDERDNTLKLELVRKAASSVRELEFESQKLAGNLGYIKFNLFFGDLLPKFQKALQDLRNTKALILDLRGNPGGAGDLAPAIANLLCGSPGSLGSLKYRYETTEYSYAGSGARAYKRKIIILTDEGTGSSTSEVFTGGLQASKRAVVIGSPSAGAVLPSLAQLLPTGGALQYVVSNFQTAQGVALEGKGVIPDATVKSTRADFLAGRDSVLEKAISFAEKGSI